MAQMIIAFFCSYHTFL